MRLQTIILAKLGLVIAASFVLNGRARAELPSATSQKEAVHIICPLKIQAGPANVPAGWQSLGNLFYQRRSISIDLEKHLIVCWYGEGNPLPPYLIAQPIRRCLIDRRARAVEALFREGLDDLLDAWLTR